MPKTQRIQTNFSKGELSPRIEGRPDLSAFFEGAREIENFTLMRQGGLNRRSGTRFVAEVKQSDFDTILIRFEFNVDIAYMIEFGNLYIRFYRNGVQIMDGGSPVEIATPYLTAELRDIHFTQSADVLFLFHANHEQQKLSRLSDISWFLDGFDARPPPSFEKDTDVSQGDTTLTPSATTGTGVTFTASNPRFLNADVQRQIIFGAARAIITSFTSTTIVVADILDDFPDLLPIPAGSWLLRFSPSTTLDPNIKEPVGAQVTFVAGVAAFRVADVGKFIKILGGIAEITVFTSSVNVRGTIHTIFSDAGVADPPAQPAGSWTLEVSSWSPATGFPRTGEFHQGRLGQAATALQPTTWWLSASDDFENFGIGVIAADALEFTIAARQVNRLEWLLENLDLFIGSAGSEFRARGPSNDVPLGGDVFPLVQQQTNEGCAHIQPILVGRKVIFVDRSKQQIMQIGFSIEDDTFTAAEMTDSAEQIVGKGTTAGIRLGAIGFQKRSDPVLYFVRNDGELIAFTFFERQKVIGFTRYTTEGTFESVGVIPNADGMGDQVWVIVRRTIGAVTKRFVEFLDDRPLEFADRAWQPLNTDSAVVYDSVPATVIPGLTHLIGETVDIVADGSFKGSQVVAPGGTVTLLVAASKVEVGLHYESKLLTMRPAIQGQNIEGVPRSWDKVFVRLLETIGGTVQGELLTFSPDPLDTKTLFEGDREVTNVGWDTVGRVEVKQTQPYPMKLLAIFGTLSFGEHR